VSDELRKKYLQVGNAIQTGATIPRSSIERATTKLNDDKLDDISDIKFRHRRGKNTLHWFWRVFKFSLVLLVLFLVFCVYIAFDAPNEAAVRGDATTRKEQEVLESSVSGTTVQNSVNSALKSPSTLVLKNQPASPLNEESVASEPDISMPQQTASLPVAALHGRMARQSATASIVEFVSEHTGDTECGDIKEVYCKADILRHAARLAYNDSLKCDKAVEINAFCAVDGERFVNRRANEIESLVLQIILEKLIAYLAEPEKSNANSSGIISNLSELCMQEAIKSGLRGKAYYDHRDLICIPQARAEFIKPQQELFKKVKYRVGQISNDIQFESSDREVGLASQAILRNFIVSEVGRR